MYGLAKMRRNHGAMELIKRKRPKPDPGEVLVEVDYAGLCGSDLGIYAFESAYERMDLPTVIGHEYSGRVVETGDGTVEFGIGDRVIERPIRGCNECYQCRIGESNICRDAAITGVDHDGAYEQFVAVPERALQRVPDGVEQQHAAIVEPASVGARAVTEHSRIAPGDRVLVEGPGPIGLLTAQIADAKGGTILVSGADQDAEYRLPIAEKLGFETINLADGDLGTRRDELTDGIGYDVVFDTTGHPSGLTTAVKEVRKGGQIVLVGQTGETTMEYSPLIRAEIDVQCSYASTYDDFERSLRMIASGDVDCRTLIDDRFSLRDIDEVFETFGNGGTVKPVFDLSKIRS